LPKLKHIPKNLGIHPSNYLKQVTSPITQGKLAILHKSHYNGQIGQLSPEYGTSPIKQEKPANSHQSYQTMQTIVACQALIINSQDLEIIKRKLLLFN